jgi:hypothetical protein
MRMTRWFEFLRWAILMAAMAWTPSSMAQEARNRAEPPSPGSLSDSSSDSVRELREQVRELQAAVAGMRSDWQRARAETEQLRRELDEVRAGTGPRNVVLTDAVAKSKTDSDAGEQSSRDSLRGVLQNSAPEDQEQDQKKGEHAASLEEEYQLLSGKVDDQYQTKVESASKYRLRLSGIVLMNLVSNQGWVDNIDIPTFAGPRPPGDSGGSFERPCDSRRSGSRRSGRAWLVPRSGRTCNSIWRAGSRRFRTGSTPDCCGCELAPCGWTGQTPRLWSGRTRFSSHRTRRHRLLRWRFPHSLPRGTCGAGFRRYGWNTGWFWGKDRACCFKEEFWIR